MDSKANPVSKWVKAESVYILDLSSENEGVRASAAVFLGRYQMKGGIETLKQTLKTDKTEQVRRAAAVGLMLMNDPAAVEAVEESSLYDGSDKVAAFCTKLLDLKNLPPYLAISE
jgi:HEAT repeat protein